MDDQLIIQRFEKILMKLLQSHAHYKKKAMQLAQEKEVLQGLLQQSKTNLSALKEVDKKSNKGEASVIGLASQINAYIKEIDLCLAYFEQV